MTRNRNSVVEVKTVGGEVEVSSAQELLQKRLACELDALRGLVKKAELISRRGAGASNGKKEHFLPPKQRPKPIEDAPLVKKRKISTLVELKQKQTPAPRMSPEERNQLAARLSSLCSELPAPAHIVVFLEKQFGDADTHGEIEINIDSVEDSVMFELKTLLDKLAKESKDDDKVAVAEESKGDTDKIIGMPGLIYRANLRRQLLEMERAALPDERIHPRDLGIAEYGHPGIMRQLGLVLKAQA